MGLGPSSAVPGALCKLFGTHHHGLAQTTGHSAITPEGLICLWRTLVYFQPDSTLGNMCTLTTLSTQTVSRKFFHQATDTCSQHTMEGCHGYQSPLDIYQWAAWAKQKVHHCQMTSSKKKKKTPKRRKLLTKHTPQDEELGQN